MVVVAKHLCGNATDYALQGLRQLAAEKAATTESDEWQLDGVFVAPCCHPKAKWAHLFGRGWLEKAGVVEQVPGCPPGAS